MRANLSLAVNFADKIKKIKHVLQIVLFGSVARGEDTKESDVDVAIIHDSKNKFEVMREVNKNKPDKVQTTFIYVKELPKEMELVSALSGEGLLLYGRPILIREEELDLKAKSLINYSLAGLPQTEKVKVNRALYGSVSKSRFKNKEYKTETKGLVKEPGIEKINRGVLLVEKEKAAKIVNMLKRFKVEVKERVVWTY